MFAEFYFQCRVHGLNPRSVVEALISGWTPTHDFERALQPDEIRESLRFARQELASFDQDLPSLPRRSPLPNAALAIR